MADRSRSYSIKAALWRWPMAVRDCLLNRACRGSGPRFLVIRHPAKKLTFYDVVLKWVAEQVPEIRGLFELRLLPYVLPRQAHYCLHLSWLQDPVEEWSLTAYRQAVRLAEECDRRGIPVVNRVDRLCNAVKSTASERLLAAGIRTPQVRVIKDAAEFRRSRLGLRLPLLIRQNLGHGGPVLRVESDDELQRVPIERLQSPIAVELIDVRCPDGLYRKHRYVVAGSLGVPHHLQATNHWITRGSIRVHTRQIDAQEIEFVSRAESHAELFQRARRALDLDVAAFDYGFDHGGRLVIWEANPFPHFHLPQRRLSYLAPAMHRTLAAVVHSYLEKAGLAIPERLAAILDSPAVSCSPVRALAA